MCPKSELNPVGWDAPAPSAWANPRQGWALATRFQEGEREAMQLSRAEATAESPSGKL